MILKMLVFHWLKHSKQTRGEEPTNKQAQSVFSAVNAARWAMCDCDMCDCFSACVCVCGMVAFIISVLKRLYLCVCVTLCVRLCILYVCVLYFHICPRCSMCVPVFMCSMEELEMWFKGLEGCVRCMVCTYTVCVWTDISILEGEL